MTIEAQRDYWKAQADRLGTELLRALSENARLREQIRRMGQSRHGSAIPHHMSEILAGLPFPARRG